MSSKRKFRLVVILGLLSAIGPFSIDMYLPGFPAIAADLQTTVARVSLSLSSFFIGISAGQVFYGPLLDRFGRKKPLYVGISIYLLASIGCAFSLSVDALIGFRLLQALGSCAGMVASRAMVRDLFPVEENAKIFSLLMLVMGVSPIIAPTVGGYLTAAFGWHSVFVALILLAVTILLSVHFFLPESRQADKSISLRPVIIIKGFINVAKEPQFYTYALAGSIASAGLYAYISGSPFVFMELYGASEKQYGWIFALIAGGLITSSQINTLLLRKYKSEQIVQAALFCQSLAGLVLFFGSLAGVLGLFTTILFCFIFLCCQGFTFPNTSALSLATFTRNVGSASALLGCIQMGLGALSSAMVSVIFNKTALPMTGIMVICATTGCIILYIAGRRIRKRPTIISAQEESAEMIITS